ncbi:MAG: zinc ribbon domain-containing protein [Coprobacillaceae bacterium]
MKQCPKCKKEVADHAKICPYCGHHLEAGYRPMKKQRGNSKIGIIYIVMAFIFMFSPMIMGYLFSSSGLSNTTSTVTDDGETITLDELKEVKGVEEYVDYHFESLDIFSKRVKDVEPMVTNIKDFEKELSGLVESKMDKQYDIYITDANNIYYDLKYTLKLNDTDYIEVSLYYDMAKVTNEANVKYYQQENKEFSEMLYQEDTYQTFEDVVKVVTNVDKHSLIEKVGTNFNSLENKFEERKKTLGHYGVGDNQRDKDNSYSIYVSGTVDNYTVKAEYQTKVDIKKFI